MPSSLNIVTTLNIELRCLKSTYIHRYTYIKLKMASKESDLILCLDEEINKDIFIPIYHKFQAKILVS